MTLEIIAKVTPALAHNVSKSLASKKAAISHPEFRLSQTNGAGIYKPRMLSSTGVQKALVLISRKSISNLFSR